MAKRIAREDIFIGRKAEQDVFAASVDEIAQNRKSFWSFGGSSIDRSQPRVFLISGGGGMGKKLLLSRFEETCRAHPVDWISLDWKESSATSDLPRDLPSLTVRLHNAIAAQVGKPARKSFRDFISGSRQSREAEGKGREGLSKGSGDRICRRGSAWRRRRERHARSGSE